MNNDTKPADTVKHLNGVVLPLELLLSDEVPLTVRVKILLTHWADLGAPITNNDIRNALFADNTNKASGKKLHEVLKALTRKGFITRDNGYITVVIDALPDIEFGDKRVSRLTAIENRMRGHKAKAGGHSYSTLKRKLQARVNSGLNGVKFVLPETSLRWLWEAGAFTNPKTWHTIAKQLPNDFIARVGAFLTQEGLTADPGAIGVFIAVDALHDMHLAGDPIRSPMALLTTMLKEILNPETRYGYANGTTSLLDSIPEIVAFMAENAAACTYLTKWAQEPAKTDPKPKPKLRLVEADVDAAVAAL